MSKTPPKARHPELAKDLQPFVCSTAAACLDPRPAPAATRGGERQQLEILRRLRMTDVFWLAAASVVAPPKARHPELAKDLQPFVCSTAAACLEPRPAPATTRGGERQQMEILRKLRMTEVFWLAVAWFALALGFASLSLARAAEPAKPSTPVAPSRLPDRRELWVPADQLKDILAKHPNAVVLSREQYNTLLRDAGLEREAGKPAPRTVTFAAAKYAGRIEGKVLSVTAEFTVQVLTDEWAQLPLALEQLTLGAVRVDGEAALQAAEKATTLLLRGRGEHRVTVEFTAPISRDIGRSRANFKLPVSAASVFQLDLPPGTDIESPQPVRVVKTAAATSVSAALTPSAPVLDLAWRTAVDAAASAEPALQGALRYVIDDEKVRGEFFFTLETALGQLPARTAFTLPNGTKLIEVTGAEVAKWTQEGGRLVVDWQSGERRTTELRVVVEQPSLAGAASATVLLPVPRMEGARRFTGSIAVVAEEGVTIKSIATDADPAPLTGTVRAPHRLIAGYTFQRQPDAARVAVERVTPRFSADLDTLVAFQLDAIHIERTVTLHEEKGRTFLLALTLPAGEEVLSVRAGDAEPDWRIEGRKLSIRWSGDMQQGKAAPFTIKTRIEPEKWTQLGADGLEWTLGDAVIEGAEKITGYIALTADPSFRLAAEPSETLERRDGRTTPVRGEYAWFRRAEFALGVKIAKRPGETLAALIGYALPLEGVLDLHAQLRFTFLHSGQRSVRVRVPAALAQNFHFDGPQIAERALAGDTWTITFQKELTGAYELGLTAQVPITKQAGDTARFEIAVPVITPLDVQRSSGVWAVEANTETEITFTAKGMNELDSLLAPPLPGYQPRHRVIGVFGWLGQGYALSLSGVRHEAAGVIASVVDRLDIITVVSTSGAERNQATFHLRTAGAQYLDIALPVGSRLLSLSVDDALVKPVGDRPEHLRVQLPAKRDASASIAVAVLYETPKGEWSRGGKYAVQAPRLAKEIPILRSQWRLYLPDGYEYRALDSNLPTPPAERAPLLIEQMPKLLGKVSRDFTPYGIFEQQAPTATAYIHVTPAPSGPIQVFGGEQTRARDPAELFAEARSRSIRQIDKAATEPADAAAMAQAEPTPARIALVQKKLERIIIPRLELRDATIREALDFLKKKSAELDDSPTGKGVNILLKLEAGAVTPPSPSPVPQNPGLESAQPPPQPSPAPNDARITVTLNNIPMTEALRYITSLANLKFKIEPNGVVIVPVSVNTDTLITKEWKMRPDRMLDEEGKPLDAKAFMEANGVQFGPGASAVFVPQTGKFIVRNTVEQLDLIETVTDSSAAAYGGRGVQTDDFAGSRVSGILPMKIELPVAGRAIVLEGLFAAERVEFRYDDWWSRARGLWLWFVAGGVACLFLARRRPWWRTCWAVLVLSFFPLVVSAGATPVCNALLGGWLVSVILQRIVARCVFARRVEVLAS